MTDSVVGASVPRVSRELFGNSLRHGDVSVFTTAGIAGFILYLVPFALVQMGRFDGNGVRYSLTNMTAASLVAVSLVDQFNLASALTQGTWILFGMVGLLVRIVPAHYRRGRRWRSLQVRRNCHVADLRVAPLPPPMTIDWLENQSLLLDHVRRGEIQSDELNATIGVLAASAQEGSAEHAGLLVAVLDASPVLRSTIMAIVLDPDDADDALQETLLAVSHSLPTFRGESAVLGWATGIARNKAKDVLRRKGRPAAPHPIDEVPTEHERFSSQWATHTDVEKAIAALSPKLRTVFELADVEGHTYLEIASKLGIERNTVASRLRRARAELQLMVAVTTPS